MEKRAHTVNAKGRLQKDPMPTPSGERETDKPARDS